MGLIANLLLVLTDIGTFFSFCRSFFDALPFAVKMLIYFVFGVILLFGLMRIILKVGG